MRTCGGLCLGLPAREPVRGVGSWTARVHVQGVGRRVCSLRAALARLLGMVGGAAWVPATRYACGEPARATSDVRATHTSPHPPPPPSPLHSYKPVAPSVPRRVSMRLSPLPVHCQLVSCLPLTFPPCPLQTRRPRCTTPCCHAPLPFSMHSQLIRCLHLPSPPCGPQTRRPPLHHAVLHGSENAVGALLRAGADPDDRDQVRVCALVSTRSVLLAINVAKPQVVSLLQSEGTLPIPQKAPRNPLTASHATLRSVPHGLLP